MNMERHRCTDSFFAFRRYGKFLCLPYKLNQELWQNQVARAVRAQNGLGAMAKLDTLLNNHIRVDPEYIDGLKLCRISVLSPDMPLEKLCLDNLGVFIDFVYRASNGHGYRGFSARQRPVHKLSKAIGYTAVSREALDNGTAVLRTIVVMPVAQLNFQQQGLHLGLF